MKTLRFTVLVIGLAAIAFGETADEKAVRTAHETFLKAAAAGDRATLEKLYAPGLQYSHSNALLENKQQSIDALVKSPVKFDLESQTIHVYGNVATIRAKVTAHSAAGDTPLSMLQVWMKNGKDWQLVERQTTRIPAH